MGNAVYLVASSCQKCKYLNYFTDKCRKGHEVKYYDMVCGFSIKRKTFIDLIRMLFYNFLIQFQDGDQLKDNPEWIKFLHSYK